MVPGHQRYYYAIPSLMVWKAGLEPTPGVPKTPALPLRHIQLLVGQGWADRTPVCRVRGDNITTMLNPVGEHKNRAARTEGA